MRQRRQVPRRTLVTDARTVIDSCVGTNLRLATRLVTRFLDARLRTAGLTLAQFGLLAHIAAAGDDTIGALAARSGLDQTTLSRNLRGLESDGLIEITLVESDLRRRAVWLTETGARRLAAAIPVWRRAQASLARSVDPHEARALAARAAALA
ncbi:MAG: MarR family winged helix-turn-helix transcriptional regulator [Alphaproteobacteria bacterium]